MPAVPKPKRGKKTIDNRDKCMILAKRICRSVGICRSCGRPGFPGHEIEAAHIIPVRHLNTAADTWNLIPLGHSCHSHYTRNPIEFESFMERIAPGRVSTLKALARVKKDIDWEVIFYKLKGEAKVAGVL